MATFTGTFNADTANASTGTLIGFTGGTVAQLQDAVGDTFNGLGASDTITAGGGDDTVFAGAGSDTVNGGDGNDTLVGNDDIFASETDTLIGGIGNDTILAEFSDSINGGAGTDFLFQVNSNPWNINLGSTSIEWMSAGFGSDTINAATQTVRVDVFAGGGNDTVTGSAFDDNLWLGAGNDTVVGGNGNDLLFGDVGADSLSGGDGNDSFYVDSADILISGGNGIDNLFWTEAAVGANIDMAANSLEFAQTFGGNDTLTAASGSANLVVFTGAGTDSITGGAGADFLWGEGDADIIAGNSGNDTLVGGTGADTLTGGGGTDTLYGNSGGGNDGALDTYVFGAGWGTDFVYDFENGTDHFDMTALGIQFSDLTVTTVGPHAHISFGGNLIVVVNGAGLIDATDFLSVWFIDNTAPGSTNVGTQANPFTSIAAFNAAQGTLNGPHAGDFVYLRDGTYTEADGINLLNGQTLIGQGQNLVVSGVVIETGSAGQTPNIVVNGGANDGIDLAQNNTISGLNVSTTAGTGKGIDDNGNVGTLTISDIGVATASGTGIELIGGGTVAVTGPGNTLSAGTGTALNITNTTIGAADVTFQSISANGAANGIVLNNTGALGGLTVTGNGGTVTDAATATGGAIQNSTGAGILLTNVGGGVDLTRMFVGGGGDDGIRGSTVTGFTLNASLISGNGNAAGENGIELNELGGSGGISNSTITGSFQNNVSIENATINLSAFNVTGTTFSANNVTSGEDGFQVVNTGSAAMNVSVTESTFIGNRAIHFQAAAASFAGGSINVTFNGNTLNTANVGINIFSSGTADTTFQINNNNLQQTVADAISIFLDSGSQVGATMTGTVSGNTIGLSGAPNSGSDAGNDITVAALGNGLVDIDILNNNIFEWTTLGMFLRIGEGDANMIAKVSGNSLHTTDKTFAFNGIRADAGVIAGDGGTLELVLTGNDVTGEGSPIDTDIRLRQRFETTIKLPDYTGANSDTAAVNVFVAANNDPVGATPAPTVSSTHNVGGGGGGFIGGAATPLLTESGGVEAAKGGTPAAAITSDNLAPLTEAAILRWAALGLSPDQLATLDNVSIAVADLGGSQLGHYANGQIVIDDDAAGRGWFIDETPLDNIEFGNMLSGTWLQTDPTAAPAGHMDVLTVIMHELGHALGLDHTDAAANHDDVMYGQLAVGERRLPDVDNAFDASHDTEPGAAVFADHVCLPEEQAPAVKGIAAYDGWFLGG